MSRNSSRLRTEINYLFHEIKFFLVPVNSQGHLHTLLSPSGTATLIFYLAGGGGGGGGGAENALQEKRHEVLEESSTHNKIKIKEVVLY